MLSDRCLAFVDPGVYSSIIELSRKHTSRLTYSHFRHLISFTCIVSVTVKMSENDYNKYLYVKGNDVNSYSSTLAFSAFYRNDKSTT